MMHSFLLIGQSNMAGRGFFDEVSPIENKNLYVLRNGRWEEMHLPVNFDRPFSGVSLAESFADAYQKDHNVSVGLIPCADGGTRLDQWQEGSLLYDNAVNNAHLAARTSNIAGVLWHQGESDCPSDLYPLYEEKFLKILNCLKRDLNLYDVPFLLGGLGDFLKDCPYPGELYNYTYVNDTLKKIADKEKMVGFVSAEGLKSNPDYLHFSANALREFGLRYYETFKTLEDKNKVFEEKPDCDMANRSVMESF